MVYAQLRKSSSAYNPKPIENEQEVEQIIEKFRKSSSLNGAKEEIKSIGEEEWECISYTELVMEGMEDPFLNKWKNLEKSYKEKSQFGHYKTY